MQIARHYLNLHTHLNDDDRHSPHEVTLEEIAAVCACTIRNAKLLVKHMCELDWISWIPGRGRGNRSSIAFKIDREDIILLIAKELGEKGEFQTAFALLEESDIEGPPMESFLDWVYKRLGYQVEMRDSRQLETLCFPFYRPIPRLDPLYVTRRTEAHMVKQLFDTMVVFDMETKTIKPHLAHYWERNEEGTVWTFYLRKGVLFHNKQTLTAHDVKATLERVRKLADDIPYFRLFASFTRIEVKKDTVIEVELATPSFLFLHFLSSTAASIIPRDALTNGEEAFSRMPIGSGPFSLARNDDVLFRLEAFPSYFCGRPHLDRVDLWIIPELKDRVVPELGGLPIRYFPFQAEKEWGEAEWLDHDQIETGSLFITFNVKKDSVVQHPAFRQAIDLMLDRGKMIKELKGKRLCPAYGMIPQFAEEVEGELIRPQATAKEIHTLLLQSGYKGEPLRIYAYQPESENEIDVRWVAAECQRYGVQLEVSVFAIEELQTKQRIQEADMILTGEVYDDNLEISLIETLQRTISFLRGHLDESSAAYVDNKIKQLIQDPEASTRMQLFRQIDQYLKAKRAILYLYHTRQSSSHHHLLSGVTINSYGWADYRTLWFKER